MLPRRRVVVEVHDCSHVARLAVPHGGQWQGEEQILEPGSGAVSDTTLRQGDTVLQVVGYLMACLLSHRLPDLTGQGAFDGRVEA